MSSTQTTAQTTTPVASVTPVDVASVASTPITPVLVDDDHEDATLEKKKARRLVDLDSVSASFDSLLTLIETHIGSIRENVKVSSKSGSTGVKFLRTISSRVKQLKKDSLRVMSAPKKRTRVSENVNSGFMKTHKVVPEMASFAGWDPSDMKSRIDITKVICSYIKDKKLYDPEKKKNIKPDEALRSLLHYDSEAEKDTPLTYYNLQKFIGRLQDKPASTTATTV